MSYDHQSPSDRADMEDDEPDGVCEGCGEFMDATEINVEAFELTGNMLCDGCAQAAFDLDPDRLREDRDERRSIKAED